MTRELLASTAMPTASWRRFQLDVLVVFFILLIKFKLISQVKFKQKMYSVTPKRGSKLSTITQPSEIITYGAN